MRSHRKSRCGPRSGSLITGLAVFTLSFATDQGTPVLAQTATPTATQTSTPTGTQTPTWTPTSCRGDLPVVEPVMSPTNLLEQTIYFCGRIVGSSFTSASTEAGYAPDIKFASGCPPCPHPGNVSCNQATIPLAPNQINHVTVCQGNQLCGAGGCVTIDVSGNPLEIAQILPTPTPPAIPVVASPGAPAGVTLAGLLVAALIWRLWRPRS